MYLRHQHVVFVPAMTTAIFILLFAIFQQKRLLGQPAHEALARMLKGGGDAKQQEKLGSDAERDGCLKKDLLAAAKQPLLRRGHDADSHDLG